MLIYGSKTSFSVEPMSRRTFLGVGALTALASMTRSETELPKAVAPRFLRQWGKEGSDKGEFHAPIGLAVADDKLFVADFHNGRVQKFTLDGKFLAAFDVGPYAGGLAVDRAGNIIVSHFPGFSAGDLKKGGIDKLTVHDASGKFVRQWGKSGKGPGEFDFPGGVAIGPKGRIYVADQTNRRVQVFTPEGKFLFQWGKFGTKPGEFGGNTNPRARTGGPQFLAFDSEGNVYTTEASVGRVQKFTADGKFLLAWGDNSTKPGGFGGRPKNLPGPIGICVDRRGRLWVSATNNRVQLFDPRGKYLAGIGGKGDGPGQFNVPHGLALDSKDNLYVADTLNHRIQVFATDVP